MDIFKISKRIFSSTAICGGLLCLPQTAAADCIPSSPSSGDTVTCSGISSGISAGTLDSLTVNILTSGSILSNGNGVEIGDSGTITNSGSVYADIDALDAGADAIIDNSGVLYAGTGNAIYVDDSGADITNSGTIQTEDGAGDGIHVSDEATVENSGEIQADSGVVAGDDATITNTATGTIEADTDGINVGDDSSVTNNGAIQADSYGIETGDDGTITNSGTILSGNDAIQAGEDATVTNSGDISGYINGIETGDNSTVTNTGTLYGYTNAILTGSGADVTNSGDITSTESNGIRVEDNSAVVNSGTIQAGDNGINGDEGNTVTNTGSITTTNGDGFNLNDYSIALNSGTIDAGDDGLVVSDYSSATNSGSITAVDNGIQIDSDSTVQNSGTIDAGNGINGDDRDTVTNSGTITADSYGIILGSDASVTNSGTITAGDEGISIDSGTVINTGTITGSYAIAAESTDTGSITIYNYGTLSGTSGTAVSLGAGDDTLVLEEGSVVDGIIEMGDGTDTVEVLSTSAETLSFGSDPEVIETAGPSIYADSTLLVIDRDPLSLGDRLMLENGMALSMAALERPSLGRKSFGYDRMTGGVWIKGIGGSTDLGYDSDLSGVMTGIDFASGGNFGWGFWFAASRDQGTLDDDAGDVTQSDVVGGIRMAWTPYQRLGFSGTFFGGVSRTELTSDADATGDGTTDGTFFGAAARTDAMLIRLGRHLSLETSVQGGWMTQIFDSYSVTGLTGAKISARVASASWARGEVSIPIKFSHWELRPYAAFQQAWMDADEIDFSALGTSTSFLASDLGDLPETTAGIRFTAQLSGGALVAAVETALDDNGDAIEDQLRASLSFRINT